ncbi:hypothetical protein EHQ53_12235 [Leptospira langatensis]|uniref:Uncharacterized protein n=1 Tax=Leptospira langatensis TaxID=2484983 RepID=A0A5F1ZT28_9LEPT|nr:hypothetical protein [Leptospira langatensis]TGJ98690.1 hypothetical protein EHO57_14270 [Leptospira langatensis]TGL40744.1 hypothetical protein EHQ53_12235 [Leptospira langatensis]
MERPWSLGTIEVKVRERMKKTLLIIILVLNYCISIPRNLYEIDKTDRKIELTRKSLNISFLNDVRSGENIDRSLFALIPLFPSGVVKLDFPESDRASFGTPIKYHFADILKREFENKYTFDKIHISEAGAVHSDYVIDGYLNKYSCNRVLYFYGLSVFGPLLWYFGAPAMITSCELDIEINIRNDRGAVLLAKKYVGEESVWSGLYYNLTKFNKVHAVLIKRFMQELLQDSEVVFKK